MATRKADFHRIIDEQQAKIAKYERKLRDVISAYKSLAAEKIALEESMKALTTDEPKETENDQPESTENRGDGVEPDLLENEDRDGVRNVDDACEKESIASSADTAISENMANMDVTNKTAVSNSTDHASKIAVLRRALATITEEKSRQEKAFTADRKNLLQEIESLKDANDRQEAAAEESASMLQQQIQEMKANLRQLQCERDCEQNDHVAMFKEIQEKLNQTRSQNESHQKQITAQSTEAKKSDQQKEESRQLIEQLLNENSGLKSKLDQAECKLAEMPKISRMQMELAQIEAQHKLAIKEEQARTSHALDELGHVKGDSESRVTSLEAKIAELTTTLSEYERLRQRDLDNTEKLKLRINELEQENTTLARVSTCRNCAFQSKGHSVDAIIEQVKKLCSDLRQRYESGEYSGTRPVDFYEILGLDSPNSESTHGKCHADYNSLKDEFEKYKLRAQAALKARNPMKHSESTDRHELDQLRRIISDLQISLSESQRKCVESESTCGDLRRSMVSLKEEHDRHLIDAQNRMKQQISDFEAESSKQRERTLEVLAEKEKELETMRAILRAIRSSSPSTGDHYLESVNSARKHSTTPINRQIQKSTESSSIADPDRRGSCESVPSVILDNAHSPRASSVEPFESATPSTTTGPNIHLAHELARKEKLVEQLRRNIRQVETTMREIERASVTKELQHYDTIEKLKEEIRLLESRLSRCQLTGGENFEYLKNVLVQYMVCDDPAGKSHMLKAISRALHLTNKELEAIQKHNTRYYPWWPSGNKK